MQPIGFNKPYLTGKEIHYIYQAVLSKKISGDGMFTQKCSQFFEQKYGFKKVLLTTSCTDALEMAAILIDTQAGDEIIMPAYTFVSSANAFVLRGAKIVFVDSNSENPNMELAQIEALITPKTKAIVVMHYAGIACDMDKVMELAQRYDLLVIEDAAQCIDSYYKDKPLGSIGHLAAFSFHETKNISSGEGGMLVINDERFIHRAEIIREKGTNRSAFFRGEIDKYNWVDIGSSFLPSDIIAAFLYAQLENVADIQARRKEIWQQYWDGLKPLADKGSFKLPFLPKYATNNAHIFYLITNSSKERKLLINTLKENQIHAVFHYLSLHSSPYYADKHDGRNLAYTDKYAECLLRLPMYYELTNAEVARILDVIKTVYQK
ncbi:MAG: dTDP-4-amino-4,6-dideoxygalactose transaminase [Bacteroidia bacterium]